MCHMPRGAQAGDCKIVTIVMIKIENNNDDDDNAVNKPFGICKSESLGRVHYSLSMTRPTNRLSVTVENVVNFCE